MTDDTEALASDWRTVGNDLRQAIAAFADRNTIDLARLTRDLPPDDGVLPDPAIIRRLETKRCGAAREILADAQRIGRKRRKAELERLTPLWKRLFGQFSGGTR